MRCSYSPELLSDEPEASPPMSWTTQPESQKRLDESARRDFGARDFVESGNLGLITVADSRFIVREMGMAWVEGDAFYDDDGLYRTVQGVSKYGARGRYLELLGRRLG